MSSLPATWESAPTELPVHTRSTVSKLASHVEMTASVLVAGVHVYQTLWVGGSKAGSPGSAVASTLVPLTKLPSAGMPTGAAKLSFGGGAARAGATVSALQATPSA